MVTFVLSVQLDELDQLDKDFLKTSIEVPPRAKQLCVQIDAVADLRGRYSLCPPPRPRIFLISCSFWENLANSYVVAPSYGESWIRPSDEHENFYLLGSKYSESIVIVATTDILT